MILLFWKLPVLVNQIRDNGPDVSLYVMTPEFGAATQLKKSTCFFADLVALNKFDKRGALDAIRDVKNNTNAIYGM
jgi:putative protein kinase ArgK-like GTPase of G3E family